MDRDPRLTARLIGLCAMGGPAALVIAFVGWLVSGVLPLPLGPASSEAEVVDFYADHQTRLLIGLVVAGLGVCLVFTLAGAIGVQMLRMEGRYPVLTFVQLTTGAGTGVLLLLPMLLMTATGFRPDRDPGLTVTLNDLAWLLFLTPIAPFMLQNVSIALAILHDRGGVFPRWAGYLNLVVAFTFVPDVLAFFFHSGPFGWNGVFIFWLALISYSVWLLAMGVLVRRAALADPHLVPSSATTTTTTTGDPVPV